MRVEIDGGAAATLASRIFVSMMPRVLGNWRMVGGNQPTQASCRAITRLPIGDDFPSSVMTEAQSGAKHRFANGCMIFGPSAR